MASQIEQVIDTVNEALRNIKSRLEKVENSNNTPLVPPFHHTSHEPAGSDVLTLLDASNFNVSSVNGAAGVPSLRALGTSGAVAAAGNDARLSDARVPIGHHVSHEPGGSDVIAATTPLAHHTTHEPGGTDVLHYPVPFYNVKDYGAVGNGVTDDATAINAAIAAWQATGGTLLFTAGSYLINAGLVLVAQANKHYTVQGIGNAVILQTASVPETAFFFGGLASATLVVRDITIERTPHATTTVSSGHGFYSQPNTSGTSGFVGVLFENCKAIGTGSVGIALKNCFDVLILNCACTYNKVAGMTLEGGGAVLISGGEYSYNVSSDGGSDYGIAIGSSGTYPACEGVSVIGVTANYNGRKGIDAHHAHFFRVISNTCIGNGASSIAGSPASIAADNEGSSKDVRDVVIAYNYIDMAGATAAAGFGIQVGAYGPTSQVSGDFLIIGNIIKNCTWATTCCGILIDNVDAGYVNPNKVIICDNTLENASGTNGWAIRFNNFTGNVHLAMVTNNIIRFSVATQGGIISSAADRHVILGNIIECTSTFTYGILAAVGPAIVANNLIFGGTPATGAIVIFNMTGSIAENNVLNTGVIADYLVRGAINTGLKIITGFTNVTVPNGLKTGATTGISFGGFTWAAAPLILCTAAQGVAAGEMPLSAIAITITTTSFTIQVDTAANVAAARTISIAWVAFGL